MRRLKVDSRVKLLEKDGNSFWFNSGFWVPLEIREKENKFFIYEHSRQGAELVCVKDNRTDARKYFLSYAKIMVKRTNEILDQVEEYNDRKDA